MKIEEFYKWAKDNGYLDLEIVSQNLYGNYCKLDYSDFDINKDMVYINPKGKPINKRPIYNYTKEQIEEKVRNHECSHSEGCCLYGFDKETEDRRRSLCMGCWENILEDAEALRNALEYDI